jgi:hypothetical protein
VHGELESMEVLASKLLAEKSISCQMPVSGEQLIF